MQRICILKILFFHNITMDGQLCFEELSVSLRYRTFPYFFSTCANECIGFYIFSKTRHIWLMYSTWQKYPASVVELDSATPSIFKAQLRTFLRWSNISYWIWHLSTLLSLNLVRYFVMINCDSLRLTFPLF